MKKFRLLSAFLSVVMAAGMFAAAVPVSAVPWSVEDAQKEDNRPGVNPDTKEPTIDYLNQVFATPEAKLASMTKYLESNGMEFWVEPVSGEFAYVNTKTGQIIFSNPFNVARTSASAAAKKELLSQIIIKYTENAQELELFSFEEACMRGQITVKTIKGGVRVEYVIGREETRKLVPKYIEKERFETQILNNITNESAKARLLAFYTLQDPVAAQEESDRKYREMVAAYPATKKGMAIYTFDPFAVDRELNQIESYIKTYCPEYTYESLEEDHSITEYEGSDKAPVLFRLSLEYMLDEDGNLDVRLPANGIRFDESTYQLTYVSVLPWVGAGSSSYEGYTMIPDGSGALVRFEDIGDKSLTLTGKVYGQDYAYQEISGQNKEVMRLPVYGVYESNNAIQLTMDDTANGKVSYAYDDHKETGFIAIIEEGESLAEITTEHGGTLHPFNSVFSTFYPRPKDSYNLAESISVGANASYTVVSERKYTGSYRIKYIMLTGEEDAEAAGLKDYYEAGYVGMAKAYRDYLINKGVLTEKTEVEDSIPLYIESFGAIETTEKFLSMPITVLKPLTTFDDLREMYEKLSAENITNVNYKLTGFANGGLSSTSPYNVEFVDEVGGDDEFTEFVNGYAAEHGIGVYPDFDFANIDEFESFDGVSNKKHMVKTMDSRYTTKRYYDSTLQSFQRGHALCVSPSVYDYFFEGFEEDYSALNPNGVSVSTLGTDLNSDFDKKDPYNREDSKAFTAELLADIAEAYENVMIEGGNAYTLGYADHILGVPLDSSRYSNASEAIPFMGMVLHGCVDFAGSPINMAGDTMYELLKAIENGASLYFTLSNQNTALLKEDEQFNKYFSVNFDIWFSDDKVVTDVDGNVIEVVEVDDDGSCDTVVELYTVLNEALADVQNKQIVDHEFLIGRRKTDDAAIEDVEPDETIEETEEAAPSGLLGGEEEVFDPYLCDDGRIVKVVYDGGKTFILNYNSFVVTVELDGETYEIEPINFVLVK